jgi:hypothetical protein
MLKENVANIHGALLSTFDDDMEEGDDEEVDENDAEEIEEEAFDILN